MDKKMEEEKHLGTHYLVDYLPWQVLFFTLGPALIDDNRLKCIWICVSKNVIRLVRHDQVWNRDAVTSLLDYGSCFVLLRLFEVPSVWDCNPRESSLLDVPGLCWKAKVLISCRLFSFLFSSHSNPLLIPSYIQQCCGLEEKIKQLCLGRMDDRAAVGGAGSFVCSFVLWMKLTRPLKHFCLWDRRLIALPFPHQYGGERLVFCL